MLSLVIPVFNEEKLLAELTRRTVIAVERCTAEYEIIFIDDGSTDGSLNVLLDMRKKNKRLKILALSRNFGHQAAYTAGLNHAKGDIVAMMDGDLQDPPELLPEMYNMIRNEGFDIVSGRKTGRKGKNHDFWSFLFHLLFRHIAGLKNIGNAGNYSMMRREAVNALLSMNEKVRYLPGMRAFIGFRQGYVEFVRDERYGGSSKMNIARLFSLGADAIFSFSRFPIKLCLVLGIIGITVFMGAGIYVLIAKMSGTAITGWSSTILSIYFLGSVQLVFLGVLGEYIYRSYKETQDRPVYFIKKYHDGDDARE